MREIEFRAWDKPNKEMVYSDKEDAFYVNTKGVLFMYKKPNGKYHKDYKVMQYTGLKDKNGVKIFEGDITEVGIVGYNDANACFEYQYKDGEGRLFPLSDIEVIGNIHDNPELLNEDN